MKTLLILLLSSASACSSYQGSAPTYVPPDSPVADAMAPTAPADAMMADATIPPQPQQRGCNMGNMPFDVTQVFADNDPVPPAILNELQEGVVGDKHQRRQIPMSGDSFCLVSGTGTLSGGVWTLTSANTKLEASIQLPPGATLEGAGFYFLRQSANPALQSYTAKIRFRQLTEAQPVVVGDVMTTITAAPMWFPNADEVSGGPGSGHGLPYVVPTPGPPDLVTLWWEITFAQGAAAFDAQMLGAFIRIYKS